MRYNVGENVVFKYDDHYEVGLVTNVRTNKGKVLGYDIRSEKGSGHLIVPVDSKKAAITIDSDVTAIWTNNGGTSNLHVDKSIGHTRANFSPSIPLYIDSGEAMGHYEKYNDMLFPVIGARSW